MKKIKYTKPKYLRALALFLACGVTLPVFQSTGEFAKKTNYTAEDVYTNSAYTLGTEDTEISALSGTDTNPGTIASSGANTSTDTGTNASSGANTSADTDTGASSGANANSKETVKQTTKDSTAPDSPESTESRGQNTSDAKALSIEESVQSAEELSEIMNDTPGTILISLSKGGDVQVSEESNIEADVQVNSDENADSDTKADSDANADSDTNTDSNGNIVGKGNTLSDAAENTVHESNGKTDDHTSHNADANENQKTESTQASSGATNTDEILDAETDRVLRLVKSEDTSTKLIFQAEEGYVINDFSHYEDAEAIDDGPCAADESKTVTMIIPYSESCTRIDVSFTESETLSANEEENMAEEEEMLASGEMVLLSLMNADTELMEEEIAELSADEDHSVITADDSTSADSSMDVVVENAKNFTTIRTANNTSSKGNDTSENIVLASTDEEESGSTSDGDALLVDDASLPSTVTIYNTGHVINYSHYGGSSSETDLYHIFSTSEDSTRRTAYCVEPGKLSPVYNSSSASLSISAIDSDTLYKVLYYGYDGPGDITGSMSGWTTDDRLIFTRLCVVYAYSSRNDSYTFQYCSDLMKSNTMSLWNSIMTQPTPVSSMSFTPSMQTVSADSNTSADITFESQGNNYVHVTVPEGVALYNRTRPEWNWEAGTTRVYAGDTFYMVTEKKDYTFNPGILTGKSTAIMMFITESLNNSRQRLVGWLPKTLQSSFQVHWSGNPEITKTVDRESNNVGEKQTWTIEAEIPNEPITSYAITDQLDESLDYLGNVQVSIVQDTENRSTAYTGASYIYEGIDWSPVFDPEWYAAQYPDVKAAFGDDVTKMLEHFINTGIYAYHTSGRMGFDIDVYRNAEKNQDLAEAYGDNLLSYYRHFCLYGIHEGRKCTELIVADDSESEKANDATDSTATGNKNDSSAGGSTDASESNTDASGDADYTVHFNKDTHSLEIKFKGSDNILENSLDKLTTMQNCKLVISFDTRINDTAIAGEDIKNSVTLLVNQHTVESEPAIVYTGSARVKKTDTEGNALANAVFGIWTVEEDGSYEPVVLDENNDPVNAGDQAYDATLTQMTAISDEEGLASFYGLKDGTYIFRETEAPEGYRLNENYSNAVTITHGSIEEESSIPTVEDQATVPPEGGKITLNAGGKGSMILRIGSILIFLFIAAMGMFRKYKGFVSNKSQY